MGGGEKQQGERAVVAGSCTNKKLGGGFWAWLSVRGGDEGHTSLYSRSLSLSPRTVSQTFVLKENVTNKTQKKCCRDVTFRQNAEKKECTDNGNISYQSRPIDKQQG